MLLSLEGFCGFFGGVFMGFEACQGSCACFLDFLLSNENLR
jgi:hypothetical protein